MPAVSEQFVSEFVVQGYQAFAQSMQGADKAMDGLEKKGLGLGKALGSALGNMQTLGTAVLGAAGSFVGAVGGIGAAITALAIDAAPLAGIEGAFAGLAESAGSGMDEMLAALKRGSSGMITNRDLMMSFNQAAQLVSVDFATQLPEAMEYLGKVAASTGEDMGFMLDSLVKGVGRLSPMILDNLGIQVNLTEANEAYAASIGKSASELTKGEQQAAIMAMTMEKLAANTAAMPDVTGSAAAGLASLKALFTDTKDEIGKAFVPILNEVVQTLLPAFQNALPGVIAFVEDFAEQLGFLAQYFLTVVQEGDWLNDWLEELPAGIQPVVQFFGELMATLGQAWGVLQSGQGPFAALMEILDNFLPEDTVERIWEFADAVFPIIESVIAWVSENVKLQDVLIALAAAVATVVIPIIGSLIGFLAPIIGTFLLVVGVITALRVAWEENFLGIQDITAAVFAWLVDAIDQVATWWGDNGDTILAKAQEVWQAVVAAVGTAIEVVSDVITTVVGAIRSFWDENGQSILATAQQVWQTILTVISTVINTVASVVTTVVGAIKAFWDANGQSILATAQQVWQTILSVISTVINTVASVVQSVVGALRAFWEANGQGILASAQTIWNTILSVISTVINAVASVVNAVVGALRANWDAHGQAFMSIASTTWDTIKTFISTAITVIKSVILAFVAAIRGDWTSFGEHLRTAADSIWDNIINIFENAATNIRTVVSEVIDAVIRFFTDTDWGRVGKSIIEGIANGISNGISIIKDAASNAARAALDAAKGFLGIKSPSAVMRLEVGRPSGEGIALGIADMVPTIQAQLKAVVPGMSQGPSIANYSVTNEISQAYQLTTQSMVREGALRMEFEAMAAAGRIAA